MSTRKRTHIVRLKVLSELLSLVFAVVLSTWGAVLYISPVAAQNSTGERVTAAEIRISTQQAELIDVRHQIESIRNQLSSLDSRVSAVYGGLWAVGGICTLLQLISMVLGRKVQLPEAP